MIGVIQIFVLLFALFAFSRAVLRYRGGSIRLAELLFWTGVWIFAIIFSLFPNVVSLLSNIGGFQRGLDLLVAFSIITLFYMLFRMYVKVDELDQTITKLVREIAITKGRK
jgi:small membrane protein